MKQTTHHLLFSEAKSDESGEASWRFLLQSVSGNLQFSASGVEEDACLERLELLAVVRGLESLDGPTRVTLVTKSRYVSRGLKRGLQQWRENDWHWDRFGKVRPIRDADLWRRIDGALKFHEVDCRLWQFEPASSAQETGVDAAATTSGEIPVKLHGRPSGVQRRLDGGHGRRLVGSARERLRRASRAAASLGTLTTSSMAVG